MRIAIDMLGMQSPSSRGRGIGRYSRSLVGAMVAAGREHEFVLCGHDGLPFDDFPDGPNVRVRAMGPTRARCEAIDRLVRENPDGADVVVLTSPFELVDGYEPPGRPVDGPALAAVVYDVVPFLHQEKYLTWVPAAQSLYRSLERLRSYDVLLAISGATRRDLRHLLGPRTVADNISGASDPDFFVPAPSSDESAETLRRLGVDGPFVFCVASMDWRKNLSGLLDAFRLLPENLRATHRLVISCRLSEEDAGRVRRMAEERGIASALRLTGEVDDLELRTLYQRCAVYAFPALFEGFGLPLLEAMHCGAPVVAGNNSAQVEVVGDAGLLANAGDAADVAAAMARVLGDESFAAELARRGVERAKGFRWEESARRALGAIERAVAPARPRSIHRRPGRERPRIALFSPFPPKGSGISDYAARLAAELSREATLDLFHEPGYRPDLGPLARDVGVFDARLFGRVAGVKGYRGIIYQMGNSYYHDFLYEMMARHPGVVALHDFGLAGFHEGYARRPGVPRGHFEAELRRSHPERAERAIGRIAEWYEEEGGLGDACSRRQLWMNRDVLERAGRLVVHSRWCVERLAELYPAFLGKAAVVPMGATPRLLSTSERLAIRDRFGLPHSSLIYGAFGLVHPNKGSVEAVEAFAEVARRHADSLLVFAGKDLTGGGPIEAAEALGIAGRVRMLGRQSDADFADLIAAADVGLCLRRPPTGGETSAALLDLLRHGVATIVTDVGTFADLPESVVRKVPWEVGPAPGLVAAMLELADDRGELGRAARRHVEANHSWAGAARRYLEEVERCRATFGEVRSEGSSWKRAV